MRSNRSATSSLRCTSRSTRRRTRFRPTSSASARGGPDVASITTWTGLEPRVQTEQVEIALRARIWDPLWLIERQWQAGELRANDFGTPVMASIEADSARLTRYLPGALRNDATDRARARDYDSMKRPLEALVERERLHEALTAPDRPYDHPRTNLRVAAEAGLHFARLLADNGVGQYRDSYLREFPLRAPTAREIPQLDAAARRWLSVVAERVIDGARLHASLAASYDAATGRMNGLPAAPAIGSTHAPAVLRAAEAWMKWHGELFDELAPAEQPPWNPERMEYEFAVAAPPLAAGHGEVVLEAPEYADGRLDWHAFDLKAGRVLGAVAAATTNPALVRSVALASPIRYPGMPSSGWFEMEDGRMNFGAVTAAPEDLARILVMDFSLEYGDEWFVTPFELDVGSVCRIRTFTVTDTFGVAQAIEHYADVDAQPSGWSLFSLAPTDDTGTTEQKKIFLLAPTLTGVIESRPAEDVL